MATAIVSEIQENNAAISTTGTWTTLSGTQYSGGTALQSTTNGNTLTLTFTGRSLYVLTQTYHHNGPTGGAIFTGTLPAAPGPCPSPAPPVAVTTSS